MFQVNGSDGLTKDDFYGTLGVEVDKSTGQNYTRFEKGPLYRAFIEGTEVDANGDQVLYDKDGNVSPDGEPKVIGKPAVFFLDEFAAMLPEVLLGVFNRAMEIPRRDGQSRTMEVAAEGGKVVKSHPGMVMFFAGNTVGSGNGGRYQMGYTAQSNRMDESTLNRITASYRFGYNKRAEKNIATGMLGDEYEVARLLKFKDQMRSLYRNEKVEKLFTTRTLVQICKVAIAYRESNISDYVALAIRDAVLNGLAEQDWPAFNEEVRMIYGIDFQARESGSSDYDYM